MSVVAERFGIRTVREFAEVGSGLKGNFRAAFMDTLDYARDPSNQIDTILFDDMSRMSRDDLLPMELLKDLRREGIRVISYEEGLLNTRKMDMIVRVKAWQNHEVARATSILTKGGLRTTARRGLYPFSIAPFGYGRKEVVDEETKRVDYRLIPHPTEAEIVKNIHNKYDQGFRIMEIVGDFNRLGIPSPTGGIWSTSTVRRIINNKCHAGYIVVGKNPSTQFDDRDEYLEEDDWQDDTYLEVPNCHEALVSLEQWERNQKRMAQNTRATKNQSDENGPSSPRSASSSNPLSEVIKCGYCTSNMVICSGGKLMCARKKNSGVAQCGKEEVLLSKVLEDITRELHENVITETVIRDQLGILQNQAHDEVNQELSRKSGAEKRLKEIRKQRDNLTGFIKEYGTKDPRVADNLFKDIQGLWDEEDNLRSQITDISQTAQEVEAFLTDPERIIRIATNYKTFLYSEDKTSVREFLRLFIKKVQLFDEGEKTIIEYGLPLPSATDQGNNQKATADFLDPNFLLEHGCPSRWGREVIFCFPSISAHFRPFCSWGGVASGGLPRSGQPQGLPLRAGDFAGVETPSPPSTLSDREK